MRVVFFLPSLSRPSGGLMVLYQMAGLLHELGVEVALTHMGAAPAGLASLSPPLPLLPWSRLNLGRSDVWCVPEGWPNALAPGLQAGARTIVYVQNWIFMLGNLPGGVTWKQLPVEFIAVSHPVGWFLREVLDLKVSGLLPPLVQDDFFAPQAAERPQDRVRVAWMPRKNKALALQIQQIAEAALQKTGTRPPEYVAIQNLQPAEVAAVLRSCQLFLAVSCAEGFGLPPLEAMASGCVPVGFTGFGGWEYMRPSALLPPLLPSLLPPLPLEDKPWGANGFFVPDGDVLAAGLALAHAARIALPSPAWRALQEAGAQAASHYTRDAMRSHLEALFCH